MNQIVADNPTLTLPPRRKSARRCFMMFADWRCYTRMLRAFETSPGHRLAYDRGRLEIMSPSMARDRGAEFLGLLVYEITKALHLPVVMGGTVTLKLHKKRKGIEGDKSYWIANAAQVANVEKLDLRIHPPPDLSIEVDVSRSPLKRFRIYAALGVPEIWRLEGDELRFYEFDSSKTYREISTSRTFPFLSPSDVLPFIQQARKVLNIHPVIADFVQWLRGQLPK